jgi:hypothetical protein
VVSRFESSDDFVPGYEASGWYGVGAPRNAPVEIVDRLNRAINAGGADTQMETRLTNLGGGPFSYEFSCFDFFAGRADEDEFFRTHSKL